MIQTKTIKWSLMTAGGLLAGLALFFEFVPLDRHHCGVSRVRSDHRSFATAIETYKIDMGAYPIAVPMVDYQINQQYRKAGVTPTESLAEANGTHVKTVFPGSTDCAGMTTPIAYTTSLFPDPFTDGFPYAYETVDDRWILYSPGPDLDYDIQNPINILRSETEYDILQTLYKYYSYDPSNGIVSNGDYWRINQ